MFKRPPSLRRGDRVRLVAPSGVFDRERLLEGVDVLEALGLEVVFDEALFARWRYLAGDDTHRQRELALALADDSARAIWTARGGYGATRLLPGLSVDEVRRAGKWFVGFSDVTALHALWARAGLMSLHGPNVTTLNTWSAEARGELFRWLMDPTARVMRGATLVDGPLASGPILGGNLTVLAAMVGTGCLPSFAGAIVLLEDIGERPYRLDRALTQLVQAGAFAGVRGFVIGQLTRCDEPGPDPGYEAADVMIEVLRPLGVPVLGRVPIGHDVDSRAVLLGTTATIDPVDQSLVLAPPDAARG